MRLALILALNGCDKIKALTGGNKEPEPEPVTVTEDPDPLSYVVSGGEISVVAIKNGDTEVPATFDGVKGEFAVADSEKVGGVSGMLSVDLSSWDSQEKTRDDNVRKLFFEVTQFPKAAFALTSLDGLPADGIAPGRSAEGDAKGKLSLHGAEVDVATKVRVTRAGDDSFHVDTVDPIYVSVESLRLTNNLKELIKACGHKSVDDNMRVTVSLDLTPEMEEVEVEAEEKTGDGKKHPVKKRVKRHRRIKRPPSRDGARRQH